MTQESSLPTVPSEVEFTLESEGEEEQTYDSCVCVKRRKFWVVSVGILVKLFMFLYLLSGKK